MKYFALGILAAALSAASAQTPPSQGGQDVIYLKTGVRAAGNILGREGNSLKVQARLSPSAIVTQTLPIANIDHVDFAGAEDVPAQLVRYQTANIADLLQKWRAQRDYLDIPNSPSGAYGLRAAQLLLESSNPDAAKSAGEILDLILKKDWDSGRRDRAHAIAIASMSRSGKRDDAIKAAHALIESDAAAESKAEVSYYLALALMAEYDAFLKENPRWESDPYTKPKRDRLYNEIIDCLLSPYLTYGAPPEFTAKSLLAASDFLEKSGEHEEAVFLAKDLVTIFPGQPEASTAKKILEAN